MSKTTLGYFFALASVLLWSGFILVSRMGGVSPLSSFDVVAIRYLTCAAILLPFWLWWKPFKLFQPKLVISSVIGGLTYALFAFKGFELSPASHAAILLPGLLPVGITVFSILIMKQAHGLSRWLGIGLITVGIGGLFGQQLLLAGDWQLGHVFLLAAALCWALYSVLLIRWQISPWQATVSLALLTCLFYFPVYLIYLPKGLFQASITEIALQAFYQGFLATVVQMLLYVRAVQLIGAPQMGAMMAIVPVIAGLAAIWLFDELLTPALMVAIVLVSLGVWLANSKFAASGSSLMFSNNRT